MDVILNEKRNYNQNKAIRSNNSFLLQGENTNNSNIDMSHSYGLETSFISYKNNQSTNSHVWDGHITLISIFGSSKAISINIRNIEFYFCCIADYISNKKLKNNIEKDIPYIVDFG